MLEKEISPISRYAVALTIRCHDEFVSAAESLKEIKRRDAKIDEIFDPIRDAQHKAWKITCETISFLKTPLRLAETIIKKKCAAWDDQERKKREEEARLAEAKRLEAERKEKEKLEARAKKAEESGRLEKAEALREKKEAVAVLPIFTPPAPPKVQGAIFKKIWKAEVTNMSDLLLSISQGKAPANLIEINQSALNAFARGVKNTLSVPGLKFYETTDMSMRSS